MKDCFDSIEYITNLAHEINNKHGFNDGWENTAEKIFSKLFLIHSEISEAGEEIRDDRLNIWYKGEKPEGFDVELADALIRILTLAKLTNIDLKNALKEKLNYNSNRPYNHGRKAKI